MIWVQGDDHTWLQAAWDDEAMAGNPEGWRSVVDEARKMAFDANYELRIQAVEVPGVYDLFEIPTVKAARVEAAKP